MTHQNTPFLLVSITTLTFIVILLPWWSSSVTLLIITSATIWQLRERIDFFIVHQFIKEFLAFGITLAICSLWVQQLNLWLESMT